MKDEESKVKQSAEKREVKVLSMSRFEGESKKEGLTYALVVIEKQESNQHQLPNSDSDIQQILSGFVDLSLGQLPKRTSPDA